MHPRGLAGAEFRRQGRCGRRRLCADRADGGHEPPLHRRLPCHHHRPQPFVGADRQPHLLGQRARHRHAAGRLAARHGHERPGAARNHLLAGRGGERLSARGRLRHHGGFGGDGDPLPGHRPEGPGEAARRHHRRLPTRQEPGVRARPQSRRRHGGAAQGRHAAQPGADAGEQPRLRAWRAVRQHRPWLQFGGGHHHGAEARRLCGDGGRLRRRSRGGEVLRHQVPQGRAEAGGGGHRRHRYGR